jgi:hypothetical protein
MERLGGPVIAAVADDRQKGPQVRGIEVHVAMMTPPGTTRKRSITNAYQLAEQS